MQLKQFFCVNSNACSIPFYNQAYACQFCTIVLGNLPDFDITAVPVNIFQRLYQLFSKCVNYSRLKSRASRT